MSAWGVTGTPSFHALESPSGSLARQERNFIQHRPDMPRNAGATFASGCLRLFCFDKDRIDEAPFEVSVPMFMNLDGKELSLKSWSDVLLRVVDYVYDQKSYLLCSSMKEGSISRWLGYSGSGMIRPQRHLCGLFVDIGATPNVLVRRARKLLKACGFSLSIAKVGYVPDSFFNPPKKPMAEVVQPEPSFVEDYAKDIRENYPNGFDFKEASCRLVKSRVGGRFDEKDKERLKQGMFERADGLWLFPDMVMADDALQRMSARAEALLSAEGFFAIEALRLDFDGEIGNVSNNRDFIAFFKKYIAEEVRGNVCGKGDWCICFRNTIRENDVWDSMAARIHEVLEESGDAVSVDSIIAQFPYLVRSAVLHIVEENMTDAVFFEVDDVEYVKLLGAYYFPEDFSEVITGFVRATELSNGVVSIVLLTAELDRCYGEGFRINYGLEDDSVFKQVVSKSFTGKDHSWNRDMFTRDGKRGESNVAEVFMNGHPDIFHEEDFFRYALESRGMKNRGMLILTFLRKHCIRLSRDWWMSIDSFETRFGMGEAQYYQIGQVLNEIVGNNRFMPISSLGDDVYDRFPRLESEGKEYPWNPYLLTSVAVHKVCNARVVNDEPSPYTVTAMILPYAVGEIDDVVEYVLGTFPEGYFTDVDSAFEYLKVNNVRLMKTEKLVAKIKGMLGIQ